MIKLQLLICKIAGKILNLLGRGSNFPGVLALKLNKNIGKYFKMPKIVVAVTGSAGKGSTSSMIAEILRNDGKKVIHNKFGSNMLPGILSLLISNSKLDGTLVGDALVVEVDERYTKKVFDIVKPKYVVITNICRDQPPRHGDFDLVYDKIKEAITDKMHLVLNGDDPYLQKFAINSKNKITYYGINRNIHSYNVNKFRSINMAYCPVCNSKLKYRYFQIEGVGEYTCKCGFERPNIDYVVNKINLDNKYMCINDKYEINMGFNVLYYAYNTLAAFSVCSLLKVNNDNIAKYISEMENNKKLNDTYMYKKRRVYVLNNKCENSTTFNQSVLFAMQKRTKRTIIIGWKEISRRYEFNDMSWLYDIEFEILNDEYTDKIICVGRDRYDIAARMKLAGFKHNQIMIYDSLEDAKDMIKNVSKGDIFAILNFDYVEPFNKLMKED